MVCHGVMMLHCVNTGTTETRNATVSEDSGTFTTEEDLPNIHKLLTVKYSKRTYTAYTPWNARKDEITFCCKVTCKLCNTTATMTVAEVGCSNGTKTTSFM